MFRLDLELLLRQFFLCFPSGHLLRCFPSCPSVPEYPCFPLLRWDRSVLLCPLFPSVPEYRLFPYFPWLLSVLFDLSCLLFLWDPGYLWFLYFLSVLRIPCSRLLPWVLGRRLRQFFPCFPLDHLPQSIRLFPSVPEYLYFPLFPSDPEIPWFRCFRSVLGLLWFLLSPYFRLVRFVLLFRLFLLILLNLWGLEFRCCLSLRSVLVFPCFRSIPSIPSDLLAPLIL